MSSADSGRSCSSTSARPRRHSGSFNRLVSNTGPSDTAGAISMTGTGSLNGTATGFVDLNAGTGGVTEAATATITAGTLKSTGGIGGPVNLAGTGNAIDNLGALAVTGNFTLVDANALTVGAAVSGTNVTITDSFAGTAITVEGMPACVAKQVARPVRNREAPATAQPLA